MMNSCRRFFFRFARLRRPGSLMRALPMAANMMALLVFLGATGCDQATGDAEADRRVDGAMNVVVTTAMIGDIVKQVGGERVQVQTLMGPGVDPHLYRATRSDVAALRQADAIFYNGLNLEGKMTDLLIQLAGSGKPVHAVTELLDDEYLLSPEEMEGHDDPHVWMDPAGWMKATEAVASKLIEFDSAHAEDYAQRRDTYLAELKRLDNYARERLATIPQQQRVLITAHDAFNYFARAYDMEVLGIQGISTDSEAGLHRIESLVDLIVDRKIGAVFTESSVSDKNVLALVEGAQARGHAVKLGGELFSDAMGAPGTYEGTYIGMIDHNVTAIVRALGGEAPEGGMNGKLKQ